MPTTIDHEQALDDLKSTISNKASVDYYFMNMKQRGAGNPPLAVKREDAVSRETAFNCVGYGVVISHELLATERLRLGASNSLRITGCPACRFSASWAPVLRMASGSSGPHN